ncbi:MAG TPA: hypothetical protein PLF32_09110 [Bacteroidales bacterium]|nr:hypothetical protein [Bacteroidales bacterium]HOR82797.1 hypothetical protein [Bacteroidales bacterium]HPJ91888.1 hypothetical protein [Bacteroidales bacterium]
MRLLKIIYFSILLTILISCKIDNTHIETYYTYNNVTIRRVDSSCTKTYFYYIEDNNYVGCIWFKYNGMNNYFRAYLVFNDDKSVDIVADYGYYESNIKDTSKFSVKDWQEEINGKIIFNTFDNYIEGNVYCLYSFVKCEPEQNILWNGGKSKVEVNCKGGYFESWTSEIIQPFKWKNGVVYKDR